MEALWFSIVAVMVAIYVVLDGFDFGAGIMSLFVAKTDSERRSVLAAIGPYWDGNEVWLLAGGGALFFAFPRAYAAGFSGFYLPLTMVLWLLMMRGLSIEFRNKEESPLWRSLWDGCFFLSSSLMAIVLGAALGNVLRGVPLTADGFFNGPLFTNFLPSAHPGVLDWYTVTIGLFALGVLAMHGSLFLNLKLHGEVQARSAKAAQVLWTAVAALLVASTLATWIVRPELFSSILSRPLAILLGIVFLAALVGVKLFLGREDSLRAFFASCVYIVSMLAATAVGAFPTLLHSSLDPANDITISNAKTGDLALGIGAGIWGIAIILVIAYFLYLFRTFAGKVGAEDGH